MGDDEREDSQRVTLDNKIHVLVKMKTCSDLFCDCDNTFFYVFINT